MDIKPNYKLAADSIGKKLIEISFFWEANGEISKESIRWLLKRVKKGIDLASALDSIVYQNGTPPEFVIEDIHNIANDALKDWHE